MNDTTKKPDLLDVAKKVKEDYDVNESKDDDVSVKVDVTVDTADDKLDKTPSTKKQNKNSKPAIHGLSSLDGDSNKISAGDSDVELVDISSSKSSFELTDEDLRADMPDVDPETFKNTSINIKSQIEKYRKGLVLNHGFTFEEADDAARKRASKLSSEANDEYLEKNPKLGVVEINKKDEDVIEFSQEEKDKLSKVKAIKLIVVEDEELKSIKVENVEKQHKSSVIQMIDGSLSKYSVPVPLTTDFATFKGAQTIQMINAVRYSDESVDELILKKAQLLYDRFIGGTLLRKYDEFGKIILSYSEFTNKYKFHDLDMGLFGIFVASSPENATSQFKCGTCSSDFQWEYNIKSLLNMDDISEEFKESFEEILSNKANEVVLSRMQKERDKAIRLKSPFSSNIYEITYPSIAKAVNLYQAIDQTDQTLVYLTATALFLSKVYLYNQKKDTYIAVEGDEYKEIMDLCQVIPQNDLDILIAYIQKMLYAPRFILKSKCPHCGNDMTNELSIDEMVFLIARDTSTEIRF